MKRPKGRPLRNSGQPFSTGESTTLEREAQAEAVAAKARSKEAATGYPAVSGGLPQLPPRLTRLELFDIYTL